MTLSGRRGGPPERIRLSPESEAFLNQKRDPTIEAIGQAWEEQRQAAKAARDTAERAASRATERARSEAFRARAEDAEWKLWDLTTNGGPGRRADR